MGTLAGVKLASASGWVQFCAPWILCFSRGVVLPAWHWEEGGCFPPWPAPGGRCSDLGYRGEDPYPWLQLLLSPPAAPSGWRCLPDAKQRWLLGKLTATFECQ